MVTLQAAATEGTSAVVFVSKERPTALVMVKDLLADSQIVMDHYEEVHDMAVEYKEYGLINFIEGQMDSLGKIMWKLRSTTE